MRKAWAKLILLGIFVLLFACMIIEHEPMWDEDGNVNHEKPMANKHNSRVCIVLSFMLGLLLFAVASIGVTKAVLVSFGGAYGDRWYQDHSRKSSEFVKSQKWPYNQD